MTILLQHSMKYARIAKEALAETLWPTRCAVCDTPGNVLCTRCEHELAYLDQWRACKRCGASFGLVQCTECAREHLDRLGRTDWPFAHCVSATLFDDETGRIVRTFKDQGEQRLALPLARIMVRAIPLFWPADSVISFVPASSAAFRKRGFDHAELIARNISRITGAPMIALFSRPQSIDQRALNRADRVRNLHGRFTVRAAGAVPARVILVDDVFTTGSTLCDATDALLAQGVQEVRCLTFARVMPEHRG